MQIEAPAPVNPAQNKDNATEIPVLKADDTLSMQQFKKDDEAARNYFNTKNSIVEVYEGMGTSNLIAAATGFFITDDGTIVTDYHVIARGGKVSVEKDNVSYDATVVKSDPIGDLAILKITPKNGEKFQPLTLAPNSANLHRGDKLFTVGHPEGDKTLYYSDGKFGHYGKRSSRIILPQMNPEQTTLIGDMPAAHGDSGSPVIHDGMVVGITDYAASLKNTDRSGITEIDELHRLLGDQKATLRDYVLPKYLHFGQKTMALSVGALLRGWGMAKDLAATRESLPPTVGGFASAVAGSLMGAWYGYYDARYLLSSLNSGSTAQKIDAGIDLTGDAMLMAGAARLWFPRTAAASGTIQLLGFGVKFLNDRLSNRKF